MKYLVVPKVVAGLIAVPLLTAIFDVVGIFGGYLVGVKLLGVGAGTYFSEMRNMVEMSDIRGGFLKSLSFGLIVTWVCTYKGFYTGYGPRAWEKQPQKLSSSRRSWCWSGITS